MFDSRTNCLTWAGRLALVICLVAAQASELNAQTAEAQPRYVTVEKNQLIEMALVKSMSSATAKEGDEITFRLTEALEASGETVLPAGWVITARVTKAEPAGENCKPGKLEWKIEDPKTPDGTTVRLRPAFATRDSDGGRLVEPMPPRSFGEKARLVLLAPIIAVGFILIAPIALALTATEREPKCFVHGCEDIYKAGWLAHAAVKQRVRVAVQPRVEDAGANSTQAPATAWPVLPVRFMP
jgi:hypothetical protein